MESDSYFHAEEKAYTQIPDRWYEHKAPYVGIVLAFVGFEVLKTAAALLGNPLVIPLSITTRLIGGAIYGISLLTDNGTEIERLKSEDGLLGNKATWADSQPQQPQLVDAFSQNTTRRRIDFVTYVGSFIFPEFAVAASAFRILLAADNHRKAKRNRFIAKLEKHV